MVLILSLASCRTREMSFGKSKSSDVEKEKISLNENHSESIKGVRVVDIRYSSKQFVGLRIYPLDTFSLSVDKGFRGRAKMVEYWGVMERVREGRDSSGVVVKKENSSEYVGESEMRKNEVLKSREVRKESMGMTGYLLFIGVGLFIIWVWWRLKKSSFC